MVAAPPSTKMYVSVVCTGHLNNGEQCRAFLARVDVDDWETTLEATKHIKERCRKCKNWYSLYEYRGMF